ncbi:MAG: (d)CMP kinase [Gammaproteobacteria bacterium]|nr:(d)CMP kinase [Gammaproteobacteria bacterium]
MRVKATVLPIVITIDGPSGSGKGTVAKIVAERLGYSLLDSGALYRLLGLKAKRESIPLDAVGQLAALTGELNIEFKPNSQNEGVGVKLDGDWVTDVIRTQECAEVASKVAAIPEVRKALLDRQRQFDKGKGLVADGRDMGTVVFPSAQVKVFLTASAEERALRRYKQLKEKGISARLADILSEIQIRDLRDKKRSISPTLPAADAVVIDSTDLSINEVVDQVLNLHLTATK